MQAVKEHCCDTGRVKGTQWNKPLYKKDFIIKTAKVSLSRCPHLGVGLYVRVLIREEELKVYAVEPLYKKDIIKTAKMSLSLSRCPHLRGWVVR